MTGFLCALPLVAGLLACPAPGRARRRLRRGRVRPPRAGQHRRARRGRGAAGRPGRGRRSRRPPGAHRRRDRARRGRGGARPGRGRARQPARGQPARGDRASPRRRSRPPRCGSREAERQAERQTALARRDVVPQANLDTARRRARHRARPRSPSSRPSSRSSGCRRAPQVVAAAESRLAGRRGRGARRRLAARQARRSPRRSPARSPTSSAASARSPARPSRWSRILPDGAYKLVVFVGETDGRRPRARHRARGALRRLPGRADRDRLLRRRRARVHPAGDLLGREPPEARLPRRGAAGRRQHAALRPGQIVDVGLGGADRDARDGHRRAPPDQALRRPRRGRRRVDDGAAAARSSASSARTARARPRRSG